MWGKSSDKDVVFYKNRILDFIINNSGEYGAQDIADFFGFSSRRIQEFVAEYNKKGYKIKSTKGKYSIVDFPDNFRTIIKKVSAEEIKKLELRRAVSEAVSKEKHVAKNPFLSNYVYVCTFTDDETYLNKLLYQLANEGYIRINNRYIELAEDALGAFDSSELLKLLIFFNVIKNVYPRGRSLHEIYTKLLLKYKEFGKSFNGHLITYPYKNKLSIYEEFLLEKIEQAIIKNKAVEIIYKSKAAKFKKVICPSGLIYNDNKELWYVADCSNGDSLYRLDRILNINCLTENQMQSIFNRETFQNSIGVSNEPLEDVEIHFEKEDYIYKKLLKYAEMRKNAKVAEINDKYILKDTVCGIREFEKWLWRFGKSAVCVKPEKLRLKITEDLELMKERYSCDG